MMTRDQYAIFVKERAAKIVAETVVIGDDIPLVAAAGVPSSH